MRQLPYSKVATWATRILISFWVTLTFFHFPGVTGYNRAEFQDMVAGEAYRPFVTRALMPWCIRTIVTATPERVNHAIEHNALTERFKQSWYVRDDLRWTPDCYGYLVAFVLSWLCLVAFSFVCGALWRVFFTSTDMYAEGFSIVALLFLPPLFKYYSYIYDFPSLLLYTLCLYLMVRRKWLVYFPVFVLSCVNKETTILLPVVFAGYYIAHHRDDRHLYWIILAIQVVLVVLVRGAIGYIFRGNPGNTLEFHFIDHNLRLLTGPFNIETTVAWLFLISVVVHQWRMKPWFLRVAVSMLVPLLGLSMLFGYLDELRGYYEIYVPALMLGAVSFLRLLGHPIGTHAPTSEGLVVCAHCNPGLNKPRARGN